ncbi:MAG: biotin/lipoyl-binding protein, partial [Eggerthellaceae bacterium]|nr:biotin/lipoyl-binding protein [Eggerthellaceae bacterium]
MSNQFIVIDDITQASMAYVKRPHPFFLAFIYGLGVIVVCVVAWSVFFKVENTTKLFGSIDASSSYVVISAQTDGILKKVNVSDGDRVHAGDVLFELENSDVKKKLDAAQADLKTTENHLEALDVYIAYLKGEKGFDLSKENPYFDEYNNRKNTLETAKSQVNKEAAD